MAQRRTIPRSQAIYPYGPGAILDSGQECFVILDTASPAWRKAPKVTLPRLQKRLAAPEGFRLPPITKEGRHTLPLEVQRFPAWLFCPRCRRMYRWGRAEEVANKGVVPRCAASECRRQAILIPMRYVAVCEGGHIGDVDWHRWAHADRSSTAGPCDPRTSRLHFEARGDKGATLDALAIRCNTCNARRTLRDILQHKSLVRIGQRCRGRQPWQSADQACSCDHEPRVLQRSQTAVHYADIVSALDLSVETPEEGSTLNAVMLDLVDRFALVTQAEAEQVLLLPTIVKKVSSTLERTVDDSELRFWIRSHFGRAESDDGGEVITQYSEKELLLEEWPALTTPTSRESTRAPLVVRREDAAEESVFPGIRNVFLIERLREVRAFRGFKRVRPDGTLVRPDLGKQPPQYWLPAIEVFGEGIFIEFGREALENWEKRQASHLQRRLRRITSRLVSAEGYAKRFAHLAPLTARFMMIHTFSHLLMRQLCYECGYGGASVRERLYAFDDRAGLLIYTADGDSEGSLGGLVRQGRRDRLANTIAAALERGSWCSNDPICREVPEHGFEKLDLAACHACAMVPETSCTHMNALLDRELVVGEFGFFAELLTRSEL
jgi:hypothetical protein